MRLFQKKQKNTPELRDRLKEAFLLGEAIDMSSRKKSIEAYIDILKNYPNNYEAWFNLGVIQSRLGLRQNAIQSFSKAEISPELRIIASFARIKSLVEAGRQIKDEDIPSEFRGSNRKALGVQGPCINAVNELKNRGYSCTIKANGERVSITILEQNIKYIINVEDLDGLLIKNIYREEARKRVRFTDGPFRNDVELELKKLEIGHLALSQIQTASFMDATQYHKLRSASQRTYGPHKWLRQGLSIEEEFRRKEKDASNVGVQWKQTLSIEGIAAANCTNDTFVLCVLNGEPHAIAAFDVIRSDHISTIKENVNRGGCIFRGEYMPMPEYPLVHIGLGIPMEYLEGGHARLYIVENLSNFMEANLQDWVAAIEKKKYTMVHICKSDFTLIASGRVTFENEIIKTIVDPMDKANKAARSIPEMTLDFKKAANRFYEQYSSPFIWSSRAEVKKTNVTISDSSPDADKAFEKAILAITRKETTEALNALRETLDFDQNHVGALEYIHSLYCDQCHEYIKFPLSNEIERRRFWKGICPKCQAKLIFSQNKKDNLT